MIILRLRAEQAHACVEWDLQNNRIRCTVSKFIKNNELVKEKGEILLDETKGH